MFKRILSTLLVAALVVFVSSAVTNAVTGSFTLHLSLKPQTNSAEKVGFNIDYEIILDLKFTVSGLTFSNRLAMGITGIEHAVFDLEANLGALTIRDDFVFATPFSDQGPNVPTTGCQSTTIATGGLARGLAPCPDHSPVGPLLFVKKRVTAVISLGGITLTNLAIFEDVNFSAPFSGGSRFLVIVGQAVPRPAANPSTGTDADANSGTCTTGADGRYNQCDQRFHFGDVLTIEGETPSGIAITAKAAFGITDRWNCVKKACWFETVIVQPEHTDNTLEKVFFHKEELTISNVRIGPLGLDFFFRWQPTGSSDPAWGLGPQFYWEVFATFDLPPIGTITLYFGGDAIAAGNLFPGVAGDVILAFDPVTVFSTTTYDFFPFFGQLIAINHALGSLSITLDGHFNVRGIRNVMRLRLDPAPAAVTIVTNWTWSTVDCTGAGAPDAACAVAGQRIVVSNGLDNAVVLTNIDLGGGNSLLLHTCFGRASIQTQFLALCGAKSVGSGFAQWAWVRYRLSTKVGTVEFVSDGTFTRTGLLENKFFITIRF